MAGPDTIGYAALLLGFMLFFDVYFSHCPISPNRDVQSTLNISRFFNDHQEFTCCGVFAIVTLMSAGLFGLSTSVDEQVKMFPEADESPLLIWWWFVLCAASGGIPLTLYIYTHWTAKKPQLHVKSGSVFEKRLRDGCQILQQVYVPTWWCPFGFAQTMVRQVFRSRPSLPFEREIVTFDDGGQLAMDWLLPDNYIESTPIVLFLPGITGSTHDCSYILHACLEINKQGYRCAVICPRGLGGVPLKTPKTYNAAVTEDIAHVLQLLSARYPNAPRLGVGFSMGGMILWNYLSKCVSSESVGLKAALIISAPWDPFDATNSIEALFPRLFFNSFLAKNLREIVKPYKNLFESTCDWEAVMSVKTVRDFDKAFIVPNFGYRDWLEYYHDAALYYKVPLIQIPTLCLNAADDCFTIPFDSIATSENVAVAVTEHGGHTAFMKHHNPSRNGLIEELLIEFCRMTFNA